MQLDMHYYGTYAMARMAGLIPRACKIIATGAQFVDDNAASSHIEFADGGRIDAQATAHHPGDTENLDAEDQRQVWVPFHFLPGSKQGGFRKRLACEKDSPGVREMVKHHLTYAKQEVGVYLMGVAAHVYADTFSHDGFSGISSKFNKVDNDSIEFDGDLDEGVANYISGKARRFFTWVTETLSDGLGHASVATYPDRPFLKWSFKYEHQMAGCRIIRDNPKVFLDGCRALHRMFTRFGRANPTLSANDGVPFADIRNSVATILAYQGAKDKRVAKWKSAAATGKLAGKVFRIPPYNSESWPQEAEVLETKENSKAALRSNLYRFYQAASIHRQYVLRELLPADSLVVA